MGKRVRCEEESQFLCLVFKSRNKECHFSLPSMPFFSSVSLFTFTPPSHVIHSHLILCPALKTVSSHLKFQRKHRMYPRVKVRLQEQDVLVSLKKDDKSIPGFKRVPQSPSVIGSSVKGKQNGSLTLPSCAKIPETCVPKLEMPLSPLSKGPTKNSRRTTDVRDDPKLPSRPNSISRPRAVLSSPENDKTIGSLNKKNIKRPLLGLKKQGLQHSTSQVYVNSVNDKRCLKQCNSVLEPHVSGQKNKLHDNPN